MKIKVFIITFLSGIVFLSYCGIVLAQAYSKQDIRDVIDYFKEYDVKAKPFVATQGGRIDELIDQTYEDLKLYKDKEGLKKFIQSLYDSLLDSCDRLVKLSDRPDVKSGFYNPNDASPEFNKLNLDSAYTLLRIKILGYLYQYRYNELPLKKDICCPLFYIYSTGNKVKSCSGQ
ncbi:MAG: hypothetical protein PHU91_06555 [Candidatus Omnitrophica bacterium]|nr:hypothetical protein [Candidatus Omnitrophota bacterium]MDD5610084.1 hypothetical protein [Candidatus Omnitrophota bacterium]